VLTERNFAQSLKLRNNQHVKTLSACEDSARLLAPIGLRENRDVVGDHALPLHQGPLMRSSE
jgi:hypothetical protein